MAALSNSTSQPALENGHQNETLSASKRATDEKLGQENTPEYPVTNLEEGIVGWDGQDDPQNPRNFSPRKKTGLVLLISSITFVSPLASSMFAPALGSLAIDFNVTDETLLSFTVSVFILGYVVGPLVLSPLSEIYGRRIVLSFANWFFAIWQIGCALAPNVGLLIFFRFMAGMGGSGCLTLGGGLIADLYTVEKRGAATALWSIGPLIGPVIGPICGGFISEHISWRWVFWILLIISGPVCVGIEIFNQETNHEVLLRWKTQRLKKELNRPDLKSIYETGDQPHTNSGVLKRAFIRPFKLLLASPIVLILCTYLSTIYGVLYLLFTTLSEVFVGQYGFSEGISGLAYLGLGVGFVLGVVSVGLTSDRMVVRMTRKNGGISEPEMRLPAMFIYASFLPVGLFLYGWFTDKHVHWIAPIIGLGPLGFGMMGVFLPIQSYMIDSYEQFAASAIAALTVTRSLVGAFLPLAGPAMYSALGLGWGNTLLGLLCVIFIPIPIALYRYGKVIRERFPVSL